MLKYTYFGAVTAAFASLLIITFSYTVHIPGAYLVLVKAVVFLSVGFLIFSFSCYKLLGKQKTENVLINLFVLSITLVIILSVSEIVVRMIFKDVTTTADGYGFFSNRWRKNHVENNSLGFRDAEFTQDKPAGVYRIAFMGDSLTFGQGIEMEQRFSNLIARQLEHTGTNQILNFGKCGLNMADHIALLKDTVILYHPDFIVFQWFVNDFEKTTNIKRIDVLSLFPKSYIRYGLSNSSALVYLINNRINSLSTSFGFQENYVDSLSLRFRDPRTEDSIRASREIEDFIALCKENGIELGIVLFPHFAFAKKEYPLSFMHRRVMEICAENGIDCLDLSFLLEVYDKKDLCANIFDCHPSTKANGLAADIIMKTFTPIWQTPE